MAAPFRFVSAADQPTSAPGTLPGAAGCHAPARLRGGATRLGAALHARTHPSADGGADTGMTTAEYAVGTVAA